MPAIGPILSSANARPPARRVRDQGYQLYRNDCEQEPHPGLEGKSRPTVCLLGELREGR